MSQHSIKSDCSRGNFTPIIQKKKNCHYACHQHHGAARLKVQVRKPEGRCRIYIVPSALGGGDCVQGLLISPSRTTSKSESVLLLFFRYFSTTREHRSVHAPSLVSEHIHNA